MTSDTLKLLSELRSGPGWTTVKQVAVMPHQALKKNKGLLILKVFVISVLLVGCSNTGDMEYQPVGETLANKQLGQNVTLAILSFPDQRPPVKGFVYSTKLATKPKNNLVGILFGAYNIRIRKLNCDQAISLNVVDALENLFKANGFKVKRYLGKSDVSSLSSERLAVQGQINEFWMNGYPGGRGASPRIVATIDIDLTIIDTKYRQTIWTGKIENDREIGPNKGIFTGTDKIFLFLNTAFSDAIEKACIDNGLLNALSDVDKAEQNYN
jgi:hypothetical protein